MPAVPCPCRSPPPRSARSQLHSPHLPPRPPPLPSLSLSLTPPGARPRPHRQPTGRGGGSAVPSDASTGCGGTATAVPCPAERSRHAPGSVHIRGVRCKLGGSLPQTSNFWERPMLPCLSDDRAIGAFWGCEGGAGSPRMIGSTNIRLRRDMGRFQGEVAFQRHQMLRERRGAGLRVRGPGVAAAAVGAEPQPRRGSGGARKRAPCGTEGPQEHAPARSRTPFLASPTPGPDRIPRLMHVGWQS